MSNFIPFLLTFGIELVALALLVSWIFRTTKAPVATKIFLPLAVVGFAILTPFQVRPLMGLPVEAFWPDDEAGRVDLWILDAGATRAYKVPIDEKLQAALTAARESLENGEPVHLRKTEASAGNHASGNAYALADQKTSQTYELTPDGTRGLPAKD
jgi:hypothetical protein